MSAIYSVNDGDDAVAADLNQLVDSLSAVLGITDTAQDALGRLVIPRGTSLPGSPSTGMEFFKTNEGVESSGGRKYVRHAKNGSGAAVWVPYLPIRQIVRSSELGSNQSITSATMTDVSGLSVSITTTGGKLFIAVVNSLNTVGAISEIFITDSTNALGSARAVVGSTNLSELEVGAGPGSSVFVPLSSFQWWGYQPVAGTYTVKLQARVDTAGGGQSINFTGSINGGCVLQVMEYGD